jgi:hypothetical protein
MRSGFVIAFAVLALGCKDSTKPEDPWVGKWQLQYVSGDTVPASLTVNGFPTKVVYRTLEVLAGGQGTWMDSSFSRAVRCDLGFNAPPTAMCNTSGMALITWTAAGDTLTVTRLFGSTLGYVVPVKKFVRHAIFLLKTDEGMVEAYQR